MIQIIKESVDSLSYLQLCAQNYLNTNNVWKIHVYSSGLSGNVVIATLRISSLCLRAKMKCRKIVVYKLFHYYNYKSIQIK